MQLEKQTALMESEKQKMEDLEAAHQQAMDSWTQTLEPRQQVMNAVHSNDLPRPL